MTQWKLVPVEPTREMIVAAFGAINYTMPEPSEDAGRVYSAMLSAAPSPDGEEVSGAIKWLQEKIDSKEYVYHPVDNVVIQKVINAAIAAMRPTLSEEDRAREQLVWGIWVDYNRAPPGSYACLVSKFVDGKWTDPEAQWMPARGRPQLQGKIRVMPHLMPGDPLIDKLAGEG